MTNENLTPVDEAPGEAPDKTPTREQIEGALKGGAALTPEEEKVIRMRNGIGLEPDAKLNFRPEGTSEGGDAKEVEEARIRLALIEKGLLDRLEEQGGSAS